MKILCPEKKTQEKHAATELLLRGIKIDFFFPTNAITLRRHKFVVLDSIKAVSYKYFKIELIDRRLSSVCYSAWIFENSSEDYYGK